MINDIFVGFRRDVPASKNVDFGIGSSFRAMLFYCREVFRRRPPAVAVRAAAVVQQLAASSRQQLLTALNRVEIIRWKKYIFVGFQKGRSGPEKRRFWHWFVH